MTNQLEKRAAHYLSRAEGGDGNHHDLLQKILFDASSRLTAAFPRLGARFLNLTLGSVLGNPFLGALLDHHNRAVVRRLKTFRRFLIIPDIHIGDAIMTQAAVSAVRDFFPEAQVDFVVNRGTLPLIEGNPEVTRLLPLFAGGSVPSDDVLAALRRLTESDPYDLCLNFCPYIKDKDIAGDRRAVLNIMSQMPIIVFNEAHPTQINHFIYRHYRFTRDLLSLVARPVRREPFRGVRLTLGDRAVRDARRFAHRAGWHRGAPVVMFNPDAASPYARIPFPDQAGLLERLARLGAAIWLGEGHTEAGIGKRLRASLPRGTRGRVSIVPASMPIEVYAALIDLSDIFISGDTGPLHLAAARRYSRSGRHDFRNRTAVLSIFGATPPHMSGYDSFQAGYLAANQDAPSWTYVAASPCRNITCLNKIYKTCRVVRCFEEFDAERLAGLVGSYLETLHRPHRRPMEHVAA